MNKIQLTFLAIALTLISTSHAEQPIQSHASISAVVNDYLTQHINLQGEYEITLVPLDSRLRLTLCPEPLEAFTTSDITHAGRVAVGVRCNAENKWSIFTSAFIKVYQTVVVLVRPLQRGEMITSQHLAVERRDVSNLREDFAMQPEQVENKQATRNLDAGTILTSRHAVEPKLIKRGDKVTITSAKPGFSIQMNGQAMMDGTKGQLIRIKNDTSGRMISATVTQPGQVVVLD
jgi:flagella basal body P-ring formation protein FlgA